MTTETFIIDSGNNGYDMKYPKDAELKKIVINHNAGFFSNCTIALQDIVILSRELGRLPDIVDRHNQYSWYKHEPTQSLIGHFFLETDSDIDCSEWFELSSEQRELQYTHYGMLNYERTTQFRDKYFAPSQYILDKVAQLEKKYKIDYDNTVGVLYRGHDKNRECRLPSYDEVAIKAEQFEEFNFLVAPDESEFLEYITYGLGDRIICMSETAHMPKKDSAVFLELPLSERAEQASNFFATMLMLSKCKHLITHTGNLGLWACIYRGNNTNVHQWRDGEWLS